MVMQAAPQGDATRPYRPFDAKSAAGTGAPPQADAKPSVASPAGVYGLGKLGGLLALEACGGALAYTKLLPRGVPGVAGLIGGVGLASLRGLGVLPSVHVDAQQSLWRKPVKATMWAVQHVIVGAIWVVLTPAFRLARLPLLAGGALLGAAVPLIAAAATRSAVGHDAGAAARLGARAERLTHSAGLWGRLSPLHAAAQGAGIAFLALGGPAALVLPVYFLLCSDICVRGVATGVAFGCAPQRQGVGTLGAMACASAACTVQLASFDWRTLGRLGRLGGRWVTG